MFTTILLLLNVLIFITIGLFFFGRWFYINGIDYICAYLHYRTNRLKISRRPKRIILIRHGESQGNDDKNIYESIPDNAIELTSKGILQAISAGEELKQIIG